MKKTLAVMLLFMLCVIVISGCSSEQPTTNSNTDSINEPSTNNVENNDSQQASRSDSIPQPPDLPED